MFAIVMATVLSASAAPTTSLQPNLICRPIVVGASRSGDIKICRTKAQWRRVEGCTGVTRYCPRKKGGTYGQATTFGLADENRVICRTIKPTGSRLSRQQLCLAKREWDRMYVGAREAALEIINRPNGFGADLKGE